MNRILIAALHSVVGSRYPRYLQMFQKYIDEDPYADKKFGTREQQVKAAIKHAMTVLKREDRVMWYLRQYRDWNNDKVAGFTGLMQQLEHYMSNAEANNFKGVLDYRFPPNADKEEILRELKTREKADEAKVPDEARPLIHLDEYGAVKVEDFMTFDDGWVWHLIDSMNCDMEADSMTHCGNRYGREGDKVLSLRKQVEIGPDDEDYEEGTYYLPHATFILNDGVLGEMKGVKNNKPGQRLHRYIIPLLEDDRIEGFGFGGHEPEYNFALEDLPEQTAKKIIADKPMLGGAGHYFKKFGADAKLEKFLPHALPWLEKGAKISHGGDKPTLIIKTYKNGAEFAEAIPGRLDEAMGYLEDNNDLDISHVSNEDKDEIIGNFEGKHHIQYAQALEKIREEIEFEEDEGDDTELFREKFDDVLFRAVANTMEQDYGATLWNSIKKYIEDFSAGILSAIMEDHFLDGKISLEAYLDEILSKEFMEEYSDIDDIDDFINREVYDSSSTYDFPNWSFGDGMSSKEIDAYALEDFERQLEEEYPEFFEAPKAKKKEESPTVSP